MGNRFFEPGGAAFSAQRDDWETPRYLYDKLNEEFGFTLDAAANDMNHKCEHYFTKEDSAFDHTWENETVFCNPPYGRQIRDWVRKCSQEASRIGTTVVMLLPARTDTIWFQQYILNNAEVRFIPGRLKYELGGVPGDSAPFPSMVVVMRTGCR